MEMMTIPQLADVSGWPASRIRRLIKTHKLPHLRLDGLTLFPANAIDEFMRVYLVKPEVVSGN
jgi:excisionase family DNA binding protein